VNDWTWWAIYVIPVVCGAGALFGLWLLWPIKESAKSRDQRIARATAQDFLDELGRTWSKALPGVDPDAQFSARDIQRSVMTDVSGQMHLYFQSKYPAK